MLFVPNKHAKHHTFGPPRWSTGRWNRTVTGWLCRISQSLFSVRTRQHLRGTHPRHQSGERSQVLTCLWRALLQYSRPPHLVANRIYSRWTMRDLHLRQLRPQGSCLLSQVWFGGLWARHLGMYFLCISDVCAHTMHRTDMKTIMAEAESKRDVGSRTPPSSGTSYIDPSPRTPQRTSSDLGSAGRTPPGPVWRLPAGVGQYPPTNSADVTPPSSDCRKSPGSPSGIARDRPEPPSRQQTPISPPRSQIKSPQPPQAPGLGHVITPARQSPYKSTPSTPRRVSYVFLADFYKHILTLLCSGGSSNPWTAPVIKPVVHVSTAPGAAASFAAIQFMQQEEDFSSSTSKTKRSLKEIQEEEQAQRAEQEFMKWWATEEERVRLEAIATAADVDSGVGSGKKRPQKPRKPRPNSKTGSGSASGTKKNAGSGKKNTNKVD